MNLKPINEPKKTHGGWADFRSESEHDLMIDFHFLVAHLSPFPPSKHQCLHPEKVNRSTWPFLRRMWKFQNIHRISFQ